MKEKTLLSGNKHFYCHQIPDRTLKLFGHYLPVCSMCTGLYTGSIISFIFLYEMYLSQISFYLGIILIIPTLIDGYTQYIGLRMSNNTLRLITGFTAGVGLILILISFKSFIIDFSLN
ncbi:MAG TPA: DUF2085 domain-containing protein [Methanobacteriaceae archaeon]|nr:DUF2085 domain-containing protein [Methanobacteriaceae archaeon]